MPTYANWRVIHAIQTSINYPGASFEPHQRHCKVKLQIARQCQHNGKPLLRVDLKLSAKPSVGAKDPQACLAFISILLCIMLPPLVLHREGDAGLLQSSAPSGYVFPSCADFIFIGDLIPSLLK